MGGVMFGAKNAFYERQIANLSGTVDVLEGRISMLKEDNQELWQLIYKLERKLDVLAFKCGYILSDGPSAIPILDSRPK